MIATKKQRIPVMLNQIGLIAPHAYRTCLYLILIGATFVSAGCSQSSPLPAVTTEADATQPAKSEEALNILSDDEFILQMREYATSVENLKSNEELAEAFVQQERIVSYVRDRFGENDVNYAIQLMNLGWLHQDLERLVDAEEALTKSIEILRLHFDDSHPYVRIGQENLSQLREILASDSSDRTQSTTSDRGSGSQVAQSDVSLESGFGQEGEQIEGVQESSGQPMDPSSSEELADDAENNQNIGTSTADAEQPGSVQEVDPFEKLEKLAGKEELTDEERDWAEQFLANCDRTSLTTWLLEEAEAACGKNESDTYNALERFWMWYAFEVTGDKARARTQVEAALKMIARMESSDDALDAAGLLVGLLVQYRQDDLAKRALKLAKTASETSQNTWTYTRAFMAAMAKQLGDDATANAWITEFRGQERYPEFFDAMYFAISRQWNSAEVALGRYEIPYSSSIVAMAAAAGRNESLYIHAKRLALNKIPGWEKTRGENMDGVRTNLVAADCLMKEFELAERRAAGLPDYWKSRAYGYLAREYALQGEIESADEALAKSTLCPQGQEACFYLWRVKARTQMPIFDLYREACAAQTTCTKVALVCGIVSGQHDQLVTRNARDFTFY